MTRIANSKQELSLRTVLLRSSALIGSKTIQDGLLSLLFIWLARTDQPGYGLIVLGLSIVMLLRSLQSLGLDQYTLRELSSSQTHTRPLLNQMAMAKFLIAGMTILIFLTFAYLKQWPRHQIVIICILLSGQCFEGLADTFFNLFRAEGQSINESISRTGPNIIASLYGAGCLFFRLDIFYFSLLFLLSGVLKLGAAIYGASKLSGFSLFKMSRMRLMKTEIISLILFSTISFFGIFYNEIQIFWLRQYHTFTDIALYRVAHDITASICGIVAQLIIGAVLFPQLITTFSHKNTGQFQEIVRSYILKIIVLGSGLALFLSLFGGKFVQLIYGNQYIPATPLVPFFGAAAFFSFINNFIIYVLLAMREEKMLLTFLCLPVSISILLGPLLIANTGPMGAALSLLLSRVTLSIVLITVIQKRLRVFKFADYKKVACNWLIAAIVFSSLAQVNFFISSCLALLTYFLLLIFDQKSEQEKIGKDTALTDTDK